MLTRLSFLGRFHNLQLCIGGLGKRNLGLSWRFRKCLAIETAVIVAWECLKLKMYSFFREWKKYGTYRVYVCHGRVTMFFVSSWLCHSTTVSEDVGFSTNKRSKKPSLYSFQFSVFGYNTTLKGKGLGIERCVIKYINYCCGKKLH